VTTRTVLDGDKVSALKAISASTVHGSAVGPVSYVITASDLHPVSQTNLISKYADDTYLIILAINIHSCSSELCNIDNMGKEEQPAVKSRQVYRDNLRQTEKQGISV